MGEEYRVPMKVVCAECMKMCCLGGKNSVVKRFKLMPRFGMQLFRI